MYLKKKKKYIFLSIIKFALQETHDCNNFIRTFLLIKAMTNYSYVDEIYVGPVSGPFRREIYNSSR